MGASAAGSISGVYKESSSSLSSSSCSPLLESVDCEEFAKEGGDEGAVCCCWILSGISGSCIGVTIGFGFNKNERVAQERRVVLLVLDGHGSLLLLFCAMREETIQAEIIVSIKCLAWSGKIWLKAASMSGTAFSMVASISKGMMGYVVVSTWCCSSLIAELVFDRVRNMVSRSVRGCKQASRTTTRRRGEMRRNTENVCV